MNKTQYDKLEICYNVGWIGKTNEKNALAAIEQYGGEETSGCTIGRLTLKVVKFPDDESAHQCKLALENCDIDADYFTPKTIRVR